MTFETSRQFREDILKLKKENKSLPAKVWELLIDAEAHIATPLEGKGKPEKLKGNLAGCFARRIDQKHRLIYRYQQESILLISCYGHYKDH